MELPSIVAKRITQNWGESGARWIDAFPTLLDQVLREWQLGELEVCAELSYNFVAFVQTKSGQPAVLKLGYPDKESKLEGPALSRLHGAATVYRSDLDLCALLLERLHPGASLWSEWSPDKDDFHTSVIGSLMAAAPGEPHGDFPTTMQWCESFDLYLAGPSAALPRNLVERARDLAKELHSDPTQARLLHGDLHHGNVLQAGDEWKIIDAKGVVGEPAFDAGTFIRNPCNALVPTRDLLKRRLRILSEASNLDSRKLEAWAFCGCVLSACWSAEVNEDPGTALTCAQILVRQD